MTIPTDKIRIVIGKGGEQIDKIIEECDDIKIDIDDDGNVVLYHTDQEMIDKAMGIINDLVREAKVGDVFDAEVIEVRDSYAFVNLFGSTDALLHVSDLSWERVEDIKSVLHVGDTVKVKVTNVDESGKVKVSMKALMEKPEGYVEPKKPLRPQHGARGDRRHFSGEHKDQGNVEKRVFRKKSEE